MAKSGPETHACLMLLFYILQLSLLISQLSPLIFEVFFLYNPEIVKLCSEWIKRSDAHMREGRLLRRERVER